MLRLRLMMRYFFVSLISLAGLQTAAPMAKPWNWMVYMCNNNNLHRYGVQNLRQMVSVGSSPNINILLQMDHFGEKEISRFYIEKNNAILSQNISNSHTSYSGTPQNLTDFFQWGVRNYAGQKNCLVLWNHGAGIKDPSIWGRMMIRWRDELYTLNPTTGLLELDRKINHSKRSASFFRERGIAFNDAAEEYLTNQDLKLSLEVIRDTMLGGKKLDILAMDACHMSMIEIASQVKTGAKIMVASAEVEPGSGYNYQTVLTPFLTATCNERELAAHIVSSYQQEYRSTLADYTQTALDLSVTPEIESSFDALCGALMDAFEKNSAATVKTLKEIRSSKMQTTEYYDSDYIDFGHFLISLAAKARDLSSGKFDWGLFGGASSSTSPKTQWATIERLANQTLGVLRKMIILTALGRNFPNAAGVGIYFPVTSIHSSYFKTEFARSTRWANVLALYIRHKKPGAKIQMKTRVEQKKNHSAKK